MVCGLNDVNILSDLIISYNVRNLLPYWLSQTIAILQRENEFNHYEDMITITAMVGSYYPRAMDSWCTVKRSQPHEIVYYTLIEFTCLRHISYMLKRLVRQGTHVFSYIFVRV